MQLVVLLGYDFDIFNVPLTFSIPVPFLNLPPAMLRQRLGFPCDASFVTSVSRWMTRLLFHLRMKLASVSLGNDSPHLTAKRTQQICHLPSLRWSA